jgi:GT2 family glycosyltransferase
MSKLPIENKQAYPLSVVIPTLGGESLTGTIEQLNRGTITPAEILVCIPEDDAFRVEMISFHNVKIIKTQCRGQVGQRAIGFQQVRHELVLQLDDDILVRETCLQSMIECIMTYSDVAVGPKMYDLKTGKYHSFMVPDAGMNGWYEKLLFWVINSAEGYKPGQIAMAGINMGVPEKPDDFFGLGWLSGGCVLHQRKNLILYNYYPFTNKAYAEDLFHSSLLNKRGVSLVRCGSAICDVDFSSSNAKNPIKFIKVYLAYARTMTRFVKEIDGSYLRLYLFLILNLFRLITGKIDTLKS